MAITKDEVLSIQKARHTAKLTKLVWRHIDDLLALALDCFHQRYLVQELSTDVGMRDMQIQQLKEQLERAEKGQ